MVQFIGLRAIFSTVTYSDHGLHVATRQETITLPVSVTSFTNTQDTTRFINTLLKFQFDLDKTARIIHDMVGEANRTLGQENIFEPMEYEAPSQQIPLSAISFFTPPRGNLARARLPIANQTALVSSAEVSIQAVQKATTAEG